MSSHVWCGFSALLAVGFAFVHLLGARVVTFPPHLHACRVGEARHPGPWLDLDDPHGIPLPPDAQDDWYDYSLYASAEDAE